jgi:solute carrier family 35, member C2
MLSHGGALARRLRLAPAWRTARTVAVLGAYYCVSASIILITKWVMSGAAGVSASDVPKSGAEAAAVAFPYPLTITTCSNTVVTVWAAVFTRAPRFRPRPLTAEQFRSYVLPIGVTTALEIGCSNVALLLLTVSFGTILKGGSPVFTLLWGILFGIETFSFPLSAAIALIAGGITLASFGEGANFVLLGFFLQLSATALGGLRWAMTQVLLKGEPSNIMPPLTATLYTSPTTALCVLPFALVLESSKVAAHIADLDGPSALRLTGLLLVIASLVFLVLVSEYWLVHDTSSLALSVAAIFKECMTIGGGMLFFHEHFSFMNFVGFVICQLGIASYVALRYDPGEHADPASSPGGDVADDTRLPLTSRYRITDEEDGGGDGFPDDDPWDSGSSPMPPVMAPGAAARAGSC